MKTINILTHSGVFHADEITACALLQVALETINKIDYNIVITRSRNKDEFTNSKYDYIVDVGGKYDGITLFDHHQFDKTDKLYGLSSAGLVYKYICKLEPTFSTYKTLATFINDVDKQDTGIQIMPKFHYCNLISMTNNADVNNNKQQLKSFYYMLQCTVGIIRNIIRKDIQFIEYKSLSQIVPILTLFKGGSNYNIVIANKYIPTSYFIGKADIIIYPDTVDIEQYWIKTIELTKNEYGSKYSLSATNRDDEIFTHKAGFIGKYKLNNNSINFILNNEKFNININEVYLNYLGVKN